MQNDEAIAHLADTLGIAATYDDQTGQPVQIALASRRAVAAAMGFDSNSAEALAESMARAKGLRHRTIPKWLVVDTGRAGALDLPGQLATDAMDVSLRTEAGDAISMTRETGRILLPALPRGYYQLDVETASERASIFLIVADARCWSPPSLKDGGRGWGLTAQVYGLRSDRNLGFGDFTDVADLAEAAGKSGASFLGLSPLHSLFASDRSKISPYSPSTRLFLETLYLDVAAEGFGEATGTPEAARLRAAGLLDYQAAWAIKRPLLEKLYARFRETKPDAEFVAARAALGNALESHATFEALSEHFAAQGLHWSGAWPEAYRHADSDDVLRFQAENEERITFHAWLQVLCERQFEGASKRARDAGMSVGLYRDLAVGADLYGSEVWARPDRYATALSVGAPPDPLGPQGQNWGFPPFDPFALELQNFQAFRDLVVANMRHAGALRIDHAYQLQRLFLVPQGSSAADGAYVDFPFEALLAILRVESHRHSCMVIAEDLGTGPKGFSDRIMRSGLLSYRLLSFERERDGAFKQSQDYPRDALTAISTHDLPTFKGWLRGFDIDLRACFGVYGEDNAMRERAAREADVTRLTRALKMQELGHDGLRRSRLRDDVLRYLARTPSLLMAVQCEDILEETNQANLPGPSEGHPNWRRRLGTSIEDMTRRGGRLDRVASLMADESRSTRPAQSLQGNCMPRATYRLQFHKGFTFAMASAVLPYLVSLGISHVYASPIQKAAAGSTHGYDVIDPREINPELGGEKAFRSFAQAVHAHGLNLLVDIVPNHMGTGIDNPFWCSVLQWGSASPYAQVFDVDWERAGLDGKLLLPVLGTPYGEALSSGSIELAFDRTRGAIVLRHHEAEFPVSPRDYPALLEAAASGASSAAVSKDLSALAIRAKAGIATFDDLSEDFRALTDDAAAAVEQAVQRVTCDREALRSLVDRQAYRLSFWRLASSQINYRRFFEINTLAGVRVEDPSVFALTHELIVRLVEDGLIDGLRIDHIDGLSDPEGYLQRLQSEVGDGFYVVAEKILEPGEKLRQWALSGTTGYDALNEIDGMLLDRSARDRIEAIYRDVVGETTEYRDALIEAKRGILERSFGAERGVIVAHCVEIAQADSSTRDIGAASLGRALMAFAIALPVYRTYVGSKPADATDDKLITQALADAAAHVEPGDEGAVAFLGLVLKNRIAREPELCALVRQRVEQLTGPVMAKSLEDTLFYRQVGFLALNEVGGDPAHFGYGRAEFDEAAQRRAQDWPASMIATATHDTKRGEDARARLFALSADPDMFAQATRRFLSVTNGPDANDRYLILQALIGAWPLDMLGGAAFAEQITDFEARMQAFLTKALREAKRHSSWTDPDEAYEASTLACLNEALTPTSQAYRTVLDIVQHVASAGAMNGLVRTILKATLPGVPDVFQGTALWDHALVDPDNRRPVDFDLQLRMLDDAKTRGMSDLLTDWRSGAIKQAILAKLLQDRAARPDLYAHGSYVPVATVHGLAFERVYGAHRLYVHVLTGTQLARRGLCKGASTLPGAEVWDDADLSKLGHGQWRNLLTGGTFATNGEVACVEIADGLPFLILGTIQ